MGWGSPRAPRLVQRFNCTNFAVTWLVGGLEGRTPWSPRIMSLLSSCSHLLRPMAGLARRRRWLWLSALSRALPGSSLNVASIKLNSNLARRGREREGAQVVALHQKLVSCGRKHYLAIFVIGSLQGCYYIILKVPTSPILGELQPRNHQEPSLNPLLTRLSQRSLFGLKQQAED